MNIGQKLGINFANTFDKSLFLYTSLKGLHILYRYSFYILLVLALYFTITKVEEVINIRSYEYIPIYIQNLLIVIGLLIKFFAVLFTMGIFAYESIYNIDLDKYLEEVKSKKFKYSKIHALAFTDTLYAIESQEFIININDDFTNDRVYNFDFDNEERLIVIGNKIYTDSREITLP